jgi:Na+/melibiose symporter-like transporter
MAMIVCGLVATYGTLHERPRLPSASAAAASTFALRRNMLEALRDDSFRPLLWSICLAGMASALNAALAMHFLTYHARVGAGEAFTWFFGAFYAGALAGVSMCVRITRRFEKHHVYATTTMVSAFAMSAGYWLVGEGRPFGTGNLWILAVSNMLVGFFAIAGIVMVPSMLADITARDELRAGRRRDGIFFGIFSFGQQLSAGLAVLVAGLLIDRFAGLVPGQTEQSVMTVERLAMISNLLPAALLAAAGLIPLRYRLTREEAQSTQRELAAAAGTRLGSTPSAGPSEDDVPILILGKNKPGEAGRSAIGAP